MIIRRQSRSYQRLFLASNLPSARSALPPSPIENGKKMEEKSSAAAAVILCNSWQGNKASAQVSCVQSLPCASVHLHCLMNKGMITYPYNRPVKSFKNGDPYMTGDNTSSWSFCGLVMDWKSSCWYCSSGE